MAMNPIKTAVSLACGLGLGSILMYLFDPEEGQNRRQNAAAAGTKAFSAAEEAVQSALQSILNSAEGLGGNVKDLGSGLKSHAADLAGTLSSKAKDLLSDGHEHLAGAASALADHYQNSKDQISSNVSDSNRKGRRAIAGIPEESTGTKVARGAAYSSGGVGLIVLGGALMYLFDPTEGRGRRDRLSSNLSRITSQLGERARAIGSKMCSSGSHSAEENNMGQVASQPLNAQQDAGLSNIEGPSSTETATVQ